MCSLPPIDLKLYLALSNVQGEIKFHFNYGIYLTSDRIFTYPSCKENLTEPITFTLQLWSFPIRTLLPVIGLK